MFDLEPGDELGLLVETVRTFASEELAPRRREAERAGSPAREVRNAYAAIGLAELELPESLGGAGLGALARVHVNEELAAADAGAALALDPLGPGFYALAELGGDAALRQWMAPLLAEPGRRGVLVSHSDAELDAALEVAADTISGRVPWVPAGRVDLLVILDADGVSVLDQGFSCTPLPGSGLRAAGASELRLDGAPVAARFHGPEAAGRALARARLYAASLLVGVLRHACEFSREYALERRAFGRPIAHHQALAFLITDMHSAVDGARLLVHEAAWRADAGLPCQGEAAAAFAEVVEASRLVGPAGVQILGGHGFMQDYPMEKAMRESRALGLWLGGMDAARQDAGSILARSAVPLALSHGGPV